MTVRWEVQLQNVTSQERTESLGDHARQCRWNARISRWPEITHLGKYGRLWRYNRQVVFFGAWWILGLRQIVFSSMTNGVQLGNYNSFEGVLYCRPHFDQLFKRTGSLDKSFEGTPKILKPEKPVDNENTAANKVSNLFGGTREKCVGCNKTVYPIEKVTVNGSAYHKSCFKCTHGGCVISPSNYIAHEGRLYCKHHHIQLFKEKGNYSQLETDQEKDLMTEKLAAMEVAA